jgi:hypothetical protein
MGWFSNYGIWLGPTTHHSKRKRLCNITKDLELGHILLEISSNRKLVVMTTALWKSRILCTSGWLKFGHLMTAGISLSVCFLSSSWSQMGLERTGVRIIFCHLERIYYWMATIWALDRTSEPCYSIKQKLAEYAVGFYDNYIRTLKMPTNALYYNIKFMFTIKALELRHVLAICGFLQGVYINICIKHRL